MMGLSDKIRVEPLNPHRVARIERNVLEAFEGMGETPRARRRRSLRWAVPALAVAAAAVAVFVNLRASQHTIPTPVVVAHHEPMRVVTGADPSRIIVGRATVRVAAGSDVSIERSASGGVSVAIATGRVDCEVEPRPGRPPFLVHAGTVKVTVVGTVFSVERGDTVRVHVTRGKVRVEDATGPGKLVAAGQAWSAATGVVAHVATREPAAPGASGTPAGAVAIDTTHKARLRRRVSKAPTVDKRDPRIAKPTTRRKTKPAAAPARGLFDELRTAAITMAPLLATSASTAREMEAAYRSISVKGRGDRAAHALYSLAYVQLVKRGQARKALKTIGFYQRRFARGKHARDVQWLRIRALCGNGPSRSCRSAAHAYLSRFGAAGERGRLASRLIDLGM